MMKHTFKKGFLENKNGLRVIGDVHGNSFAFRNYVEEAKAKNFAILSLGDITDRGPDSPGAMRVLLDMIRSGDGDFVPGNHCWKAARKFMGRNVQVNGGLEDTVSQLAEDLDGDALGIAFADAVCNAKIFHRIEMDDMMHVFAHAAIHRDMMERAPFSPANDKVPHADMLRSHAFYGQSDGTKTPEGYPHRVYDWIHTLPYNVTAYVGHDYIDNVIVTKTGKMGATIHHLDTGAGKGGQLSFMDLEF